jgi:hypothetical protein
LGSGQENFYADPPVDHLSLWSSPDRVTGWSINGNFVQRTTALTFLLNRLGKNQLTIIR